MQFLMEAVTGLEADGLPVPLLDGDEGLVGTIGILPISPLRRTTQALKGHVAGATGRLGHQGVAHHLIGVDPEVPAIDKVTKIAG